MLIAELITELTDAFIGSLAIVVFAVGDMVCGTENDVVMRLFDIGMGGNDVGVMPIQKLVCKLDSDGVRFLIGNLAGVKRLDEMIGLRFAGILRFGEFKGEIITRSFRTARVRRNQDLSVGLGRVTDVFY